MDRTAIIEALIPAHLAMAGDRPALNAAEKAQATAALSAIRALDGKARVAIHEAIKAGAKSCAGA